MTEEEKIALVAGALSMSEREWLTGWQGPAGAAFNAIGECMAEMGMTVSRLDWNLSPLGLAVHTYLENTNDT
jgi:hypothetical protein